MEPLKFGRKTLLEALKVVGGVVPSRTTKDILKSVKLSCSDGVATLTATDLEIGMRYSVAGLEVPSSGEMLLPTQRLLSILQEVKSEEVVLSLSEGILEITSGKSKFRLPAQDVTEFPDVPEFSLTTCPVWSAGELKQAIRRVIFAADGESHRCAGEKFSVTVDPGFLIDFLRTLEPESMVELGITDAESPLLFRCGENYKYVVMPMSQE